MTGRQKSLQSLIKDFDDVADLALGAGDLSVSGRNLADRLDKGLLYQRIVQGVEDIINVHESLDGEKLTAENASGLLQKFRAVTLKLSQKGQQGLLDKLEQIGVAQTPLDLSFLKS